MVVLIIVLYLVALYFFIFRNYKTRNFGIRVSNMCYKRQMEFVHGSYIPHEYNALKAWEKEMEEIDRIVEEIRSVPYEKMLFSFKSFSLENWYTEEQVKFLRGETHRPEDFYVAGNNVDMTIL